MDGCIAKPEAATSSALAPERPDLRRCGLPDQPASRPPTATTPALRLTPTPSVLSPRGSTTYGWHTAASATRARSGYVRTTAACSGSPPADRLTRHQRRRRSAVSSPSAAAGVRLGWIRSTLTDARPGPGGVRARRIGNWTRVEVVLLDCAPELAVMPGPVLMADWSACRSGPARVGREGAGANSRRPAQPSERPVGLVAVLPHPHGAEGSPSRVER
jgi:hypothetical protein